MSRDQILIELSNVGILLNAVNTEGEKNLNNLLSAIQRVRAIKKSIEEEANENHDQQGKDV